MLIASLRTGKFGQTVKPGRILQNGSYSNRQAMLHAVADDKVCADVITNAAFCGQTAAMEVFKMAVFTKRHSITASVSGRCPGLIRTYANTVTSRQHASNLLTFILLTQS